MNYCRMKKVCLIFFLAIFLVLPLTSVSDSTAVLKADSLDVKPLIDSIIYQNQELKMLNEELEKNERIIAEKLKVLDYEITNQRRYYIYLNSL